MTIITQNFINEIKNSTFNILNSEIFNLFSDFFENIFFNFSNNKYIHYSLNLISDINYSIINILKKIISIINFNYRNSDERKKYYYISKSNVPRTINTIWGTLDFERDYYVSKDKTSCFFFIDKLFDFEKYSTYDPIVRGLCINSSTHINVNKTSNHSIYYNFNILNYLQNKSIPDIPRQTIYNWINNWNIPTVSYTNMPSSKILYVMTDEKWIHEQLRKENLNEEDKNRKHYIMSKCFVIFTGIKRKKNRAKLLNKHVFITSSTNPYKKLMDEICTIYDFENIEEINLLSDAGNWILSGSSELKLYNKNNIKINICEFHVKQKINRITNNKELRQSLIDIIYKEENKERFIENMEKIIEQNQKRKEKLIEYLNYIKKHWKGIINMKYSKIKSSMESHISHCVAEHFGSRPKAYSKDKIEKYIKLEEAKQNEINILDLYLKSYNKKEEDNYKYNEKEIDFSLFDKSTTLLPIKSSKNPISFILHSLAYN